MQSLDRVVLAAGLCLLSASTVRGASRPLLASTPADALAAVYFERANSDHPAASRADVFADVVGRLRQMGLFGEPGVKSRIALDLLHCWPVLRRHPQAFILHDIHFRGDGPDSNQLDRLGLSLVLDTAGDNAQVRELVQYFLNIYTNRERAEISTFEVGGKSFHRLVDQALPEWAVWEWGQLDNLFLISVGAGSSGKIAEAREDGARSILGREWFETGHRLVRGAEAGVEVYLDVPAVLGGLGDGARTRLLDLLSGLEVDPEGQHLWTIGANRAVFCFAYHHNQGQTELTRISDPAQDPPAYRKMIPGDAERYAIVHAKAETVLRRAAGAYLAIQNLSDRFELRQSWEEMVKQQDLNIEEDLLSHLGDHIIIHNHPQHPLGLPLMYTLLIEIKGDSSQVNTAVTKMLDYLGARLDLANQRRSGKVLSPVLRKSYDGIWYLQYGVYGPAVLVTSGWLAISYSPEALRANLAPTTQRPAPSGASVDTPSEPSAQAAGVEP